MEDAELREEISTSLFVNELTRYALAKHRPLENVEWASTTDDYVQEAFKSVIEGRRTWNRERYRSPMDFMKSVVDSVASNARGSAGRKRSLQDVSADQDLENPTTSDPEIAIVIYDEYIRVIGNDAELFAVMEGRLDDRKRGEIAEEWGISVDQVTNDTKRLFRRVRDNFDMSKIPGWGKHE